MTKPTFLTTNAGTSSSWSFACWLIGVVYVLRVISSVYALKLREISPTLILVPGAYSKTKIWKQTNSSTGFKNQGAPKILLKLKFNLTMILNQVGLN